MNFFNWMKRSGVKRGKRDVKVEIGACMTEKTYQRIKQMSPSGDLAEFVREAFGMYALTWDSIQEKELFPKDFEKPVNDVYARALSLLMFIQPLVREGRPIYTEDENGELVLLDMDVLDPALQRREELQILEGGRRD